ncbi:MAG: TolC family protein [Deltaproteobacteria bacterium]|nr:TolC family protein [Deltaproteobacteria bacterium]
MKKSVLLLILTFFAPRFALSESFTLEELYELALKNSRGIEISKQDTEIAKYNKYSSLSNMGPKFSASAKYLYWNEPTDISFGFEIPPQFKNMGISIPDKMHVMDQDTKDISITITQPITPLYSMYQVYKINRLNEEASKLDLVNQTKDIKYKVAESYFNLLKLQKTKENLTQSKKLIEAYREKTEQFYKNGMVQKDDVMKVDVKLAQINDGLNEIDSAIEIVKASINILTGRDKNAELELRDTYSKEPVSFDYRLQECIEKALTNRDDIRALRLRVEMLEAKKQATIGTLIPSTAGLFTYSHQWGNAFQKEESWFVGVSLSWTFWEWGTTYFQLKANSREIEKDKNGLYALSDGVTIDVKNAFYRAKNSFDAIKSNKKSIELAEEVYRISVKKYENAQITATEVLDAETMLTTAKINYTNSLYTYYLNLEYLRKAINEKEDL